MGGATPLNSKVSEDIANVRYLFVTSLRVMMNEVNHSQDYFSFEQKQQMFLERAGGTPSDDSSLIRASVGASK